MKISAKKLSLVIIIATLVIGVVLGVLTFRLFDGTHQRQIVIADLSKANTLLSRASTAIGMLEPTAAFGAPRALKGSLVALEDVKDISQRHGWNQLLKNVIDAEDILSKYLQTYSSPPNDEYALFLHQQSLLQFNLLTEQLSRISTTFNEESVKRAQRSLTILAGAALWIIALVGIAAFYFYQRIIFPVTRAKDILSNHENTQLAHLGQRSAIELQKLFEALDKSQSELEYKATHDFLTGLNNRFYISKLIESSLSKLSIEKKESIVMILDLDNFKNINDTLGHEAGDELLKLVADNLLKGIGDNIAIARLGGDEFCIYAEVDANDKNEQFAFKIVQRIQDACAPTFDIPGKKISVSISIGIAFYPQNGTGYNELLRNADAAMYKAKSEGKSTFAFYSSELTKEAEEQMQLESDLMVAIRERQFYLDYQVQWETSGIIPYGVEALIRWKHPQKGLISPMKFIPLAERSWLIEGINDWVLTEAIHQVSKWQKQGIFIPSVSVNLSAMRFQNSALVGQIQNLLQRFDVAPEVLCLEITEYTFQDSEDYVADNLNKLRALGVRISVDDFGTGYSSLSKLRNLPVDEIKIDRSFVDGIENGGSALTVFESMLSLCQGLSFSVVAEGVETSEQLNLLQDLGCDLVQGYYLARPESASTVTAHFNNEVIGIKT